MNEFMCPECGSTHVVFLTLFEGNKNEMMCQSCYCAGSMSDFKVRGNGLEEVVVEDKPDGPIDS